jgi:nicotinamide mononucleotide transporter
MEFAQQVIVQLRASSPLEVLALISGFGYALLAVRRDRRAWVFGAVSSASLAWLAAGARLPLQAALQSLYVVLAVYGYRNWSRGSGQGDTRVTIGRWPARHHVWALLAIVLGTLALAPLLARWTDGAWPRLDAAVTLGSLLATWLTARAIFENWHYWLIVDAASFVLYFSQGLALVSVLFAVYFTIAFIGLRRWSRDAMIDAAGRDPLGVSERGSGAERDG